jgi:hypothetical protein
MLGFSISLDEYGVRLPQSLYVFYIDSSAGSDRRIAAAPELRFEPNTLRRH